MKFDSAEKDEKLIQILPSFNNCEMSKILSLLQYHHPSQGHHHHHHYSSILRHSFFPVRNPVFLSFKAYLPISRKSLAFLSQQGLLRRIIS
uniref:Uncharacterized protein n=1 Tax=Onchocerca volvulus TaxID=6282 RepID=A0A8R1TJW3_ONCVO